MPSKPRSLAGILHSRRPSDREYNRARRDPALAAVYGSARWQAVRLQVLRDEPCCRECARHGVTELATQVDHVVPLATDLSRAFDRANLAPTCTACHAAKSAADRANLSAVDRSAGGGGEGHLSAMSLPSGRRGVSLFSRDEPGIESGPRASESALGASESASEAAQTPSGGPPGALSLDPRDVEAMAVGLALTHDLPLGEARARIQAALARGDRHLEVP